KFHAFLGRRGIIGCLLPVLPGPPLSYAGLLLMQLKTEPPFTTNFMLFWAAVAVGVTVLDYIIPAYGTKKYGGSRAGVIGTFVGLFVGIFFVPFPIVGIILGPLVGAFIGESIMGKNRKDSFRAAFGSFVGFLFGTLIKLIASGVMTFYYVSSFF
ncbi:MAG: DUF456 domain-containing protein, partial [Bacteroidota bacterium]